MSLALFTQHVQTACAVLYCHLWSVRLYHIFRHVIKGTIFGGKKVIERKMCGFDFLYNFFSEIFPILRSTERDMIKNLYCSSCKVAFILVRF